VSDISQTLERLLDGENLKRDQAESIMDELMSGALDDAQIGAFLTALRSSGETAEEIAGFARAMREHAKSFDLSDKYRPLIDTCGTGGDSVETINISTLSAIAAAGAGANVAKHGNRSVSSRCGSADLLEQLGVKLELTPDQVKECIRETGIGFMYAPAFHASMKHAIGPRKSLGIRTVFNLLGPLTNPAGADRQLVGVFGPEWVRPIAEALSSLGVDRALVVHGTEGMDEISPSERTVYAEVENGSVSEGELHPEDFDVSPIDLSDIRGGGPEENEEITRQLLSGDGPGPVEDVIAINAGAVTYLAGEADDFVDGANKVRTAIRSGDAEQSLEELVEYTRDVAS
jgi:anthranilate phosphoribosyltransferase